MSTIQHGIAFWTIAVPHLVYPTATKPTIQVRHYDCSTWRGHDDGKESLRVTSEDGESVEYELHGDENRGVPMCVLVKRATERI